MKDFSELMQQATRMQSKLLAMQEDMAALEVVGESGAGLVRVVLNGVSEVKKVDLDPSLKAEEWEVLEDLVAAAFNDGAHKLAAAHKEKFSPLLGGIGPLLGKLMA